LTWLYGRLPASRNSSGHLLRRWPQGLAWLGGGWQSPKGDFVIVLINFLLAKQKILFQLSAQGGVEVE
jgi:hypothetical protein